MKQRYVFLLSAICCVSAGSALARNHRFYNPAPQAKAAVATERRAGSRFWLNLDAMHSAVLSIPGSGDSISVPLPGGAELSFPVREVTTLLQQDPASPIRTFSGLRDGKELRLTLSDAGMMGMIESADGTQVYFGPESPATPDMLISYDAATERQLMHPACGLEPGLAPEPESGSKTTVAGGDDSLRTYIIGITTTGEYTTWAGSVSAAQAYVTATINNVNLRYERDFNVHFTLSAPSANIYTIASSDPFSTVSFPSATTLNEANTTLNTNLGNSAYNVGMVFGYGWSGGLAQLGAVCSGSKGRAAGGLNSSFPGGSSGPVMDDLVAHEIGHQFNATHTMASNNGSCSGNTNPITGWEPGGGSTIMAYAGSCTGNSYQTNSDHYFHAGSIAQVMSFITSGTGSTCPAKSYPNNATPVVSVAASSYNIPHSTPFKLTASASDPDASDVLTYTWEQLDAIGGTGTSTPPVSTATSGPNFRSLPPVTYVPRYFPSLEVLTGAASGTYEVLPTVARTMNFRLTARDNHSGAGRTAHENVAVVTQGCGPFAITSQTTATSLSANGSNTVTLTWNPATACVTMPAINVRFSTDGGLSFPYLILEATPNDGSETFTVPNYGTCEGRFMIESIGNVYHNISAADISLSSACAANGATFSPSTAFAAPAGNAALSLTQSPDYGTAIGSSISGTLTSADPAGNLSFFDQNTGSCSGPSNAMNYDTIPVYPNLGGGYSFTFSGGSGGRVLSLYEQSYQAGSPCNNFITSNAVRQTGQASVSLASSLSATLCANKRYVLLVSAFGSGTPVLPSSYTVNVSAPAGGGVYTGTPPPAGFNYCYAVVSAATDAVLDVSSSPDLSNSVKYPSGVYEIYGISSSGTCSALATTFTSGTFSAMRTAIQNQSAGICAQLSANSRTITVGSGSVLPLQLLSFTAAADADGNARLSWRIRRQESLEPFVLERSLDGSVFAPIATVPARVTASGAEAYLYTDQDFKHLPSGTVYYRLRIREAGAVSMYSGIEQLRKQTLTDAITLSPNPLTQKLVTVTIAASERGTCTIIVADIAGRNVVEEQRLEVAAGTTRSELDLGELPAGVYFIRAVLNGNLHLQKLVKY